MWKYNWKDEFWAKLFMQDFFGKNNIELTRVSINKINNNNEFTEYNIISNWGNKTIKRIYKPDIIRSRRWIWTFHKYEKLWINYDINPSMKISIISNDKYETYLFLKKYQPKTILLSSFLSKKNKELLGDSVVIKPIRANWWKWIELTTPNSLYENRDKFLWLEELYIVQEFKDFSSWYKWIVKWCHDIRLMFAWKNIIEATLRIPKEWGFKSNIWSWWKQKPLKKELLPKELLALSKKIYKELNLKWDDIMSMDFAYCWKENKWYLIEINASPWTRYYQEDKLELTKICKWLVKFFKSLN